MCMSSTCTAYVSSLPIGQARTDLSVCSSQGDSNANCTGISTLSNFSLSTYVIENNCIAIGQSLSQVSLSAGWPFTSGLYSCTCSLGYRPSAPAVLDSFLGLFGNDSGLVENVCCTDDVGDATCYSIHGTCLPNQCSCPHGEPAAQGTSQGPGTSSLICMLDGTEDCARCDDNYLLSTNQSELVAPFLDAIGNQTALEQSGAGLEALIPDLMPTCVPQCSNSSLLQRLLPLNPCTREGDANATCVPVVDPMAQLLHPELAIFYMLVPSTCKCSSGYEVLSRGPDMHDGQLS